MSFIRHSLQRPALRYKNWFTRFTKTNTQESTSTVAALQNLIDYYGRNPDKQEVQATNNYEVQWDNWNHIMTPGVVSGLKAKFDELKTKDYNTEKLADQVMVETEDLSKLGHKLAYNAYVHGHFVFEQVSLIENLNHARPFENLNKWEVESMIKYMDVPSRWDRELNWILLNNDQTEQDFWGANLFQFQKDNLKSALPRYYYDWLGKHQYLCTTLKLSGWETER